MQSEITLFIRKICGVTLFPVKVILFRGSSFCNVFCIYIYMWFEVRRIPGATNYISPFHIKPLLEISIQHYIGSCLKAKVIISLLYALVSNGINVLLINTYFKATKIISLGVVFIVAFITLTINLTRI